jgi:hypothetical protein
MKIPHKHLEWARRDPAAYATFREDNPSGRDSRGGPSFYGFWRIAAFHYHKLAGDREAAVSHYMELVKKNFLDNQKNQKKLDEHVEYLNNYFDDFERLNSFPSETRKRIDVDVGFNIHVIGEVPRIDIVLAGGFAAYFFEKKESDWQSELRYPFLQHHLSKSLGCRTEDVAVGVFCLETQQHEHVVFQRNQIDNANRELARVLKKVRKALKP